MALMTTQIYQQDAMPGTGPNPYSDLNSTYSNSMGDPDNNDYYPVANGSNDDSLQDDNADEILWVKCLDNLWRYEDLCFRPQMSKIVASWAQYNNIYESDGEKDDWQSRKASPIYFVTLERLAQAFTQFVRQKPRWFKSKAALPPLAMFSELVTSWLSWWLDHTCTSFFAKLEESFKEALITGHIHVAVTVELDGIPLHRALLSQGGIDQENFLPSLWDHMSPYLQEDTSSPSKEGLDSNHFPFIARPGMPRLCLEVIPTLSVRLDSSGRDRYKMWKTTMGLGEFLQTAHARGWDEDACLECIGGHSQSFEQELSRQAMQHGVNKSQEPIMHFVELLHFEGILHNPATGKNCWDKPKYLVMANNRRIVCSPRDNPFLDGESLLVSAPFIKNSTAVYGRTFLAESLDMMDVRHDLNNVLLDYIRMTLQPPRQVDRSVLSDQEFIDSNFALYPNAVVQIRSNGVATDAIRPIQQPDLPQGFWQFMQFYTQNQQEAAGISPELMGSVQPRTRQTASAQSNREAQAGKFLEGVFMGLEDRFLKPLVRIMHLRLLQFTGDDIWGCWIRGMKTSILPSPSGNPVTSNPQLLAAFRDQLDKCAAWDMPTRYKYFGGFFTWDIEIFNNLYGKEGEIEGITMFLKTIAAVPNGLQTIRLPYFLAKLTEAYGWDPFEALTLENLPIPDQTALDSLSPETVVASTFGGSSPAAPFGSSPDPYQQYLQQYSQARTPQPPPGQPPQGQPNLPQGPPPPTVAQAPGGGSDKPPVPPGAGLTTPPLGMQS